MALLVIEESDLPRYRRALVGFFSAKDIGVLALEGYPSDARREEPARLREALDATLTA